MSPFRLGYKTLRLPKFNLHLPQMGQKVQAREAPRCWFKRLRQSPEDDSELANTVRLDIRVLCLFASALRNETLGSVEGLLAEAAVYVHVQDAQVIRSEKFSHVDGILFTGQTDLTKLSLADHLDWIKHTIEAWRMEYHFLDVKLQGVVMYTGMQFRLQLCQLKTATSICLLQYQLGNHDA